MVVDHLGIVVRSLERSLSCWLEVFGYEQASPIIVNSRQKVRVVFLSKENSVNIKLVEPEGHDSAVSRFAAKGGGLHHICFRCNDLRNGINHFVDYGAKLLVPPEPGEAFNDNNIAFLLVDNLNIELIDSSEKRKLMAVGTPRGT